MTEERRVHIIIANTPDAVEHIVDAIVEEMGGIDYLIENTKDENNKQELLDYKNRKRAADKDKRGDS